MRLSYKKTKTGWAIHHQGHLEETSKLLCYIERGADGWSIPLPSGHMGPYRNRWIAGQAYLNYILDPVSEKLEIEVADKWRKHRVHRQIRTLTQDRAMAIYDVLVRKCGAEESGRGSFVYFQTKGTYIPNEWRFCGILGFGGKFWNTTLQWYVSAYEENLDAETRLIVAETNEILQKMYVEEYGSP